MYIVPNMEHFQQTKTMACWYASAQMLVSWKRNETQMSTAGQLDPSEDPDSKKLWQDNTGMTNERMLDFARRLGLVAVPPMSPTATAIKGWLMRYGPLWVNGKSHIVVIAGIQDEDGWFPKVLVYNPAFPASDSRAMSWKLLDTWYVGNEVSSRDTSSSVQAVFLYNPH
jgi:ABC-type bacteriocin/lantibiotic exporter with double-glycine peptidase domain